MHVVFQGKCFLKAKVVFIYIYLYVFLRLRPATKLKWFPSGDAELSVTMNFHVEKCSLLLFY